MTFSYVLTTDIGRIRLRIRDTIEARALFSDEEIEACISAERDNWKRGAALCLETIATNEALILKVIKELNLSTDGAKLADSLMKQAQKLRDQADEEDAFSTDGLFDWAELGYNPASVEEILRNDQLRNQ